MTLWSTIKTYDWYDADVTSPSPSRPTGWREASEHYNKYRVMSSTISVDLVPQPLISPVTSTVTSDTVTNDKTVDASATDYVTKNQYMDVWGQGSDAVTSVVSLHQQHF